MRILNIVESLDKGAVENWLVNCFIEISKLKPGWKWTFFCIIENEGKLEGLVKENGGTIIKSPFTISDKRKFCENLADLTRKMDFDIIHAHHDYMNAYYLLSFFNSKAYKISHIHNTDKHLPIRNRFLNSLMVPVLRIINNIGYDRLIGISIDTVKEFKIGFFSKPETDILYYGISLEKFRIQYEKEEFLSEFNLSKNSKLLLFVGRFTELKNPSFLIDILYELNTQGQKDYYAIFVGEGDQKQLLIEKADRLNLSERIRLIDWVDNPERFFQLSDFFIFPRKLYPKEGFGIVMLEAQAAGIKTIVSAGVSYETIVNQRLVVMLDNVEEAKYWANEINNRNKLINRKESLSVVNNSKFNIEKSAMNLIGIYEGF
jgi:glycosyltransferase EpsF